MTFKEKLIILRKSKGLTQDDFASAVGVSRQAVYKWESGQSYPEVPKLLEMKLLFSVSIDELLDDSYDLPVPEKKKRKRAPKENAAPKAPKAAPVAKPAPAPKAAPVAQPAPAPKAAPVAQPAPAPKAAPVAQPAPAPKAAPVAQPAPAPVAQPAPAPKAAPVAQPAPAPVAQPAPAPVAQPAPAPVAQPAPAPKAEEPKVDTVPNPILLEDIVADDENKADKKGGFFDRLFGRR